MEAGTICAVTGLSYTYPGEGLGSQEESELPILEPVLTYELILPDGVQPQAMMPKLAMLEEEEPELHKMCIRDRLWDVLQKKGIAAVCESSYLPCGLAMPRKQEVFACVNRYRRLGL